MTNAKPSRKPTSNATCNERCAVANSSFLFEPNDPPVRTRNRLGARSTRPALIGCRFRLGTIQVVTMLLLEDVKKSFTESNGQKLPVLDIPRFQLDAGEQMVLLGRSGCGKTTLLHVIAGISRIDSGRIEWKGRDLTVLSEPGRDRFRAAMM